MAGKAAANGLETIGVRVPKPMLRAIDDLAEEHGLSRSEVGRRLLRYSLKNGNAEIFQPDTDRQITLPNEWRNPASQDTQP